MNHGFGTCSFQLLADYAREATPFSVMLVLQPEANNRISLSLFWPGSSLESRLEIDQGRLSLHVPKACCFLSELIACGCIICAFPELNKQGWYPC